jgi:hypothetical protein
MFNLLAKILRRIDENTQILFLKKNSHGSGVDIKSGTRGCLMGAQIKMPFDQ